MLQPHRVLVLVDENSNPFEMGCACEIFGAERPELGHALYEFRLCAPNHRVRMRGGLVTMHTTASLRDLQAADTIIVPNRPDTRTPHRRSVLQAIRGAHERGVRLVGLCTGVFTRAEAGVLDGRRATGHWQLAAEFRARHLQVELRPDVLYVDDGDILTSAGSAAALDLALHIVRTDHGGMTSTGRPYALGLFRSVAMVAALMRKNVTQEFAGAIFGVSQSTVSRRWDLLRPAIGQALACFAPAPQQLVGAGTVLVDGTICPTWDWRAIPDLYSGKAGYPGMNIQIAVTMNGSLAAVGATPAHGARHDAHAYAASGLAEALADLHTLADLAYTGVDGIDLAPIRKPADAELQQTQRLMQNAVCLLS